MANDLDDLDLDVWDDDDDDGDSTPVTSRDLTRPRDDDTPLVKRLRGELKARNKALSSLKGAGGNTSETAALKLELVLADAGLRGLSSKKRNALLNAHEGDFSPDSLLTDAVDLGWAEAPEPTEEEDAADASERIERAAESPRRPSSTQLTPELVAKWTPDVWVRFAREHPVEAEALKRGEPVKAQPGY